MNVVLNESLLEKLTDNEKRVYDYLVENDIEDLRIKDLSKNTYTSSATVIRTAKKLGFKGYKELLYYLMSRTNNIECDFKNQFYIKNNHSLDELFEIMGNKKVLFYSEGLAINIAKYLHEKMLMLGKKSSIFKTNLFYLSNKEENKKYDAFIIINRLARGKICLQIAEYMKKNNVKVVVVTSNKNSELYKISDIGIAFKEDFENLNEDYYPTLFFGYVIIFFESFFKKYREKKYSFMKKNSK